VIERALSWWSNRRLGSRLRFSDLVSAGVGVFGLLLWQTFTAQGNPDPTTPALGRMAAVLSIGVLVFREGLESILVLVAVSWARSLLRFSLQN